MSKLVKRSDSGIEKYDPAQGLKNIAIAEVAEKLFARAKDAGRLLEAVEHKLMAQREFICWWDGREKQQGARTPRRNRSVTPLAGHDGLPDRMTLLRWRSKLKDEQQFEATLAAAQMRCVQIVEQRRHAGTKSDSESSEEPEWYTPEEYLAAVRDVLGEIDLDPASSDPAQRRVRAIRFFTKREDGLRQEWQGRVFLNPPYTHPELPEFVGKMVAEYRSGRVPAAIMLTHNYTDTGWFHLAVGACVAVCFTKGRVKFLDVRGNEAAPTQGQAFFYYGQDRAKFVVRFRQVGFVLAPL